MLKVLGRPNSINVQKVMWLIGELGLEHERLNIGGAFGGNDQPDYLSKNPNGRIPTLEDGDAVIWESNAIVRYVAEKYGPETDWHPSSVEQRGQANMWMDWYLTTLHPPMTKIFWELIRTPEPERDKPGFDKAVEDASKFWTILDRHLASRSYVLGNTPSMGDIPVGCSSYRWLNMEFDRPSLPSIKAYHERLRARPAYQQHVMLPLT